MQVIGQENANEKIDFFVVSQRIRITKSKEKTHQDHIADRGQVSISHCNMMHKPNPSPTALNIPEENAPLEKVKIVEATSLGRAQSDQLKQM